MSDTDKLHVQDSTKEETSERDGIWTSGFDSLGGASLPPPPLQLVASTGDNADQPPGGGLSPEQLALIQSLGLGGMVSSLPESEQNEIAQFLADFQSRSTVIQLGEGRTIRSMQSGDHSLKISVETLPGQQVQKTVEYRFGSNEFKNVLTESSGDLLPPGIEENEPLTVELADGPGESVDVPGKGSATVLEQVLSLPESSTRKGVENDQPVFDRHLHYSRKVMVRAADGRTIGINVHGRTNLDKAPGGPANFDIQGDSYLSFEFMVSDGQGQTKLASFEGGGNSLREALASCAGNAGSSPILLQPGEPTVTFVDAALVLANKMVPPAAINPEKQEVQVVGEGGGLGKTQHALDREQEVMDHGPQVHVSSAESGNTLRPWGEMLPEEKRAEALREFRGGFSWGNVGKGVLVGLGIMGAVFGLLSIPAIAPVILPALGLMAIAMGIWSIAGPLLAGKTPPVAEWIKGGLLVIGGIAVLVATVLAAPELLAAATFTAIAAGILYLVVEFIDANLTLRDASKAATRDEMKAKAAEAAKKAEQSIIDGILAVLPIKKIQKAIDNLGGKGGKPTAPGEEGMPSTRAEDGPELNRQNEADQSLNRGDLGPDEFITEAGQVINAKFWKPARIINGRKVYQRDDLFDPNFVDDEGVTNLRKMQRGNAPTGYDGDPVNIHHLIHIEPGAVAEVGGKFHQEHTNILHFQESGKSFRTHDGRRSSWPRTRSGKVKKTGKENAFGLWKKNYWKSRAEDFN